MHANTELQRSVLAELDWDPRVDASQIGVAAVEGVVTLTGQVSSFPERIAAEEAVKRVIGVRGVANDLAVVLPGSIEHSDTELVQAAVLALQWDVLVPDDRITVEVAGGWLKLDGEVEREYQRTAAERAVRELEGLLGCENNIVVKPAIVQSTVKQHIEAALKRRAELDTRQLQVSFLDGEVTLKGTVHSWREHDDALNARAPAGEGGVGGGLELDRVAAAPAAVGGDHQPRLGVLDPILQCRRRKTAEHHRMDGTDAVAGVHRDQYLRHQRHVDDHAVAAADTLRPERVGAAADLRVQLTVAQPADIPRLAFEDDRGLVATLAEVDVETVM